MNVKLLLDENLSPRLAEVLRNEDKLDAVHIRDRGLLGAKDHEVLERACAEDRVLATKKLDDFVKLARARHRPSARRGRRSHRLRPARGQRLSLPAGSASSATTP